MPDFPVNIVQRKIYESKVEKFSSEDKKYEVKNILSDSGSWRTEKSDSLHPEFVVLDYNESVLVNFIELLPSGDKNSTFPSSFRFEVSDDGESWRVLFSEHSFVPDEDSFLLHLPLTSFRYLKLFIASKEGEKSSSYYEVGKLTAGIYGIGSPEVNKLADGNHTVDNLLTASETYWLTKPIESSERVELVVDLNTIFPLISFGLKASEQMPHAFPNRFTVEVSSDKRIWTTIVDQKYFQVEPGGEYVWSFDSIPGRYIRLEMDPAKVDAERYAVALSSLLVAAMPLSFEHSHTFGDAPSYASVFQPGLVRFAKDGEDTRDAAVRANDRRLRDATTFFKGIVQFAENGADTLNTAVMAADSRLKPATELSAGIVQLAYDYETKKGTAVQASDPRLKDASEKSPGIVRLCADGACSELGVVRGSDSRLKEASENSAGIVKLAPNGKVEGAAVIQSHDSRLKDASQENKGIVSFSKDGEAEEGKAVESSDRRLKEATVTSKGIVELADDGEDTPLTVVQGSDRRLKDATTEARGIVELAENEEIKAGAVVQSTDNRLKNASTDAKGIVELASDGEDAPFKAVQGNDRRLKDATTVAKGIVELADDGEVKEGTVVQSNDKRLRDATTTYKGIVELAEDGEVAEGRAVQGNDKRLRDASTDYKGIMQFANNNEAAPFKAVQSNDERLRDAALEHPGIVALADNGEVAPFKAIQANDRRLKDATTEAKGIVQFAKDREEDTLKAVQSDDSRLKGATTVSSGIVRLAKDGEALEGAVVQSNDKRLVDGSEEQPGIVRFAKNGESREHFAVQAHDERLSNKREPLAHTHDYAPLTHEFNSHSGRITLTEKSSEKLKGIMPPPDGSSVIYARNTASEEGAVGVSGIALTEGNETSKHSCGVLGHSGFVGVRGQATGHDKGAKGAGVLGASRNAPGGLFASEYDYSLVVEGYGDTKEYDDSLNLAGNGEALLVRGKSAFEGSIRISSDTKDAKAAEGRTSICELFALESEDFVSHGDIVVASEKGESLLKRTHTAYDKRVIGVVANNEAVTIDNTSGEDKKLYPVALTGTVMCKVDARNQAILPGDLIVTSDTPGCGMKGQIDSFDKIGSVIGKALDKLESGTGVIPIFITHS